MLNLEAKIAVFIDYDNLLEGQKRSGILDVVTRALIQISLSTATGRGRCDIRIYGGWYEGAQITRLAEDVAIEIQRDFPKIIRLPVTGGVAIHVSTNAELAVALLQEPGYQIFNTYRRKGKPANVRVENPAAIGCTDSSCILPQLKALLKTGSCPKLDCEIAAGSLVYRHEQKIVDTMLTCDLIHAARGIADWIILVSGDDDFLPPLRTILLNGATVARFHTRPNSQRASLFQNSTLLEMDL